MKKNIFLASCIFAFLLGIAGCSTQSKALAEKQAKESALLEKRLAEVRSEAINAQANVRYPLLFQNVQDIEKQAMEAKSAGDLGKSNELTKTVCDKYQILTYKVATAKLLEKINTNQLAQYDQSSFTKAGEAAKVIDQTYDSDTDKALSESKVQLENLQKVVKAGFTVLIGDAEQAMSNAKARISELKVSNNLKSKLEEGNNLASDALKAQENGDIETAYEKYKSATELFVQLDQIITLRRQEAVKAMEAAKQKQSISQEVARDADKSAPLPDNAKGFSTKPIEVEILPTDTVNKPQVQEGNKEGTGQTAPSSSEGVQQ